MLLQNGWHLLIYHLSLCYNYGTIFFPWMIMLLSLSFGWFLIVGWPIQTTLSSINCIRNTRSSVCVSWFCIALIVSDRRNHRFVHLIWISSSVRSTLFEEFLIVLLESWNSITCLKAKTLIRFSLYIFSEAALSIVRFIVW